MAGLAEGGRNKHFGDGLAVGPDLVTSAESAVTQALEGLDGPPDLVLVFVSEAQRRLGGGEDSDLVAWAGTRAMEVAGTPNVIGCSGTGVIGGNRGVEDSSAVSAWAGRLPGALIRPFRLETLRTEERMVVVGTPAGRADDAVAVLLADPYTFPVDAFVARSGEVLPGLPLIGGLASGARGRGSVRLFVEGEVLDSGAVGVVLGGSLAATTVVSQGCRPIGPTMVVTKAEDNIVREMAGVPALEKLEQIVRELSPGERELVEGGLQLGVAMNEYADEHQRGDFLIRGVIGADSAGQAIATSDVIEVGRTVRFHVRDAATAGEDLAMLLSGIDPSPVKGALLFSCNGRGRAMFPSADHDVRLVRRVTGPDAVGGFFAAGEIGPVAGRNHVHAFTASILAFGPQGQA